jgi:polar amino acid transport system substrate-binding protein
MIRSPWGRRSLLAAIGLGFASIMPIAVHAESKLVQVKKQGYIRVATVNEVPYGYIDANGNAAGIGPDVAKAVLKTMGITDIQWTVTPFGSLIPGLKANRFDLVAAEQNILPDRCKQVLFTQPNSSYGEGLLVKAGNPKDLHSYDNIKKNPTIKAAVVSGADELGFLHAVGVPDSQIVTIPTNAAALSTVETGRADAYAATELTVARLAQHSKAVAPAEPFKDPVVNGKVIRAYGGFSLRMQDRDLYNAFNTALVAFKKTPEWRRILSSYGLGQNSIKAAQDTTMQQLCASQ